MVGLKSCFDEIMSSVTSLNDKTSKIDAETSLKISGFDKNLTDLNENVSAQKSVTKILVENVERVSKQFGIFREKANRDSARLESEVREIGDLNKTLLDSTSESLPKIEASLVEHWHEHCKTFLP